MVCDRVTTLRVLKLYQTCFQVREVFFLQHPINGPGQLILRLLHNIAFLGELLMIIMALFIPSQG